MNPTNRILIHSSSNLLLKSGFTKQQISDLAERFNQTDVARKLWIISFHKNNTIYPDFFTQEFPPEMPLDEQKKNEFKALIRFFNYCLDNEEK